MSETRRRKLVKQMVQIARTVPISEDPVAVALIDQFLENRVSS
jgi:hypothetical protein